MKTLPHTELADAVRDCADTAEHRFWIATPYIGGWASVECIIGNKWIDKEHLDVRLLTDIEEKSAFAAETLRAFRERADVKHILGLHAKIYIFDQKAIITSANLTRAAFTKRHEIGVLLEGDEAIGIINIFEDWWLKSAAIEEDQWEHHKSENIVCRDEHTSPKLKAHTKLRPVSKSSKQKLNKSAKAKGLTAFNHVVREYGYFIEEYLRFFKNLGRERLWPEYPINLETDRFMNFLFHQPESRQPSKEFSKADSQYKQFTLNENRFEHIKQNVSNFIEFTDARRNYIEDAISQMNTVKRLLSFERVDSLSESEVREIFFQINASKNYGNFALILKNNALSNIKQGLKWLLLVDKEDIIVCMAKCKSNINYVANHTVCELAANLYSEKYPKINANSLAGLRYLGYDVPHEIK